MAGKRALGVLHGHGKGRLVVEVFGQSNAILAGESKADVVPWVDGRGAGIVGFTQVIAGGDACLIFGEQTPHLAAKDAPAIVEFGLAPRLAQAEGVAVGLSGSGSNAGRKKVAGHIAGELYVLHASVDIDGRTRLAG